MDAKTLRSTTRYDIAAALLRYWWLAVAFWLLYSVWTVTSIAHDVARGR